MAKPESCDIEDVRREARKIEEETGRPVEIYEHFVENSDGTRTHTAGFRTKPRAVREAAEVVLKRGGKPMRDEDGVVRLHWPELETNAAGAADSDNEKTPEQQGHFEVTAWPIRSPETACLILDCLLRDGNHWSGFPARDLKQTAMLLEAHALKHQERIETAVAVERNPILAAILHHFYVQPGVWRGTASELLEKLEGLCKLEKKNWSACEGWPKTARNLSHSLTRQRKWLLDAGITFERRNLGQRRQLTIGHFVVGDDGDEVISGQSSVFSDEDDASAAPTWEEPRADAEDGNEVEFVERIESDDELSLVAGGDEDRDGADAAIDEAVAPADADDLGYDAKLHARVLASIGNHLKEMELRGALTLTDAGIRDFSDPSRDAADGPPKVPESGHGGRPPGAKPAARRAKPWSEEQKREAEQYLFDILRLHRELERRRQAELSRPGFPA